MFPISDSDLRTRRRPLINVSLIVLCLGAFTYELIIGESGRLTFFYRFGAIPNELAHGIDYQFLMTSTGGLLDIGSPLPNWATMFTSMFIHADWLHFAVNMLFLWVFGDNIEDRFGHIKYLVFYLAAGVIAVWLQVAVNTASEAPTIGASGAIAGVLGAYFLLFPYSRVRTAVLIFIFPLFVRIPAVFLLGFWFVIQFFSGVGSLVPAMDTGGVAYWAHIGGFLAGVGVVVVYKLATHQRVWPRGPGGGTPQAPELPQYWRGDRFY